MKEKNKSTSSADEQSIEELQKRYQTLHTRKIQAETNLDNATRQLESLKQEARETYGTDDVAELHEKLDAMKAENEEKRKNYQTALDRIESELEAVEQKFAVTENLPATPEEQS
jgi:chromosome segregation ATPase